MVNRELVFSEIGMVPADWRIVNYTSLGEIIDGDRGRNYPSKRDFRENGFCLFLDAGNVTQNGFLFDECQFITKAKEKKLRKGLLKKGDCVLTTRGTVGNIAYFNEEIPFDKMRINSGMVILRKKSDELLNDFHYHLLRSVYVKKQIQRLAFGSAQPQLTVKGISTLNIPLPSSILEQEKISITINDIDKYIAALEKLIAKKRAIKTAVMQQLLTGKTRLPGFDSKWHTTAIGEVCDIFNGGTPRTTNPDYWDGSIPWCTPSDITAQRGKYLLDTKRKITELGLQKSSANLLPAGSILLCTRATIGEVKIAGKPIATNQGFKSLICQKEINNDFLYYLLLMIKNNIIEKAVGSTFLEVSKKDLKSLSVEIPELEEQLQIAQILSDIDEELIQLNNKHHKLLSIKTGMMQELLTGRTRLI
jgi:type I restriction enzyme S subunit